MKSKRHEMATTMKRYGKDYQVKLATRCPYANKITVPSINIEQRSWYCKLCGTEGILER